MRSLILLLVNVCLWSKGGSLSFFYNEKEHHLWDNLKKKNGMYSVPYYFGEDVDNKTRRNVNRAISSLYAMTCVEFRPAEIGDNSIIMFKNGSKCSSFIGRKKGISKIEGCKKYGKILNAIMNALGFPSETLRPDRDDYVIVFQERMKIEFLPKIKPRFSWVKERFNLSYDINSVTHYDKDYLASGDEPTIYDISTGLPIIKNNWAFSFGDIKRVRTAYNCSRVAGARRTTSCYQRVANGIRYRGNVSVTKSGLRCQNWKGQTPHEHFQIPSRLTGSGLFKNRCRNPNVRNRPWCFTKNESVRWEYCRIPICNTTEDLPVPTHLVSTRGYWGPWSPYTRCSRTCDDGLTYSVRHCIGSYVGSEECPGDYYKYTTCNYKNCTEHEWRKWTKWSECNVECGGGGRQFRIRTCNGLVGLDECVGDSVQNVTCNATRECPLDECYDSNNPQAYNGSIDVDRFGTPCLDWMDSKLNVSEYPEFDLEGNYCRKPEDRRNVPYCFVKRNQRKPCNVTICNLKARWANWGRWSACSSSCGEGIHTRIRACFRGDYGEGNCTGETFTTKECNVTCENGIPVLPDEEIDVPATEAIATIPPSGRECVNYLNPRAYRGTKNRTKSGLPCQYWDSVSPIQHNYSDPDVIEEEGLTKNYCRAPDPGDATPWCFVRGFYPVKEDCFIRTCPYNSTEQQYFYRLWISFAEQLGIEN